MRRIASSATILVCLLAVVSSADGRQSATTNTPASSAGAAAQGGAPDVPSATIDDTIEAGESDSEEPARKLIRWNEYEGPWFTIRAGGGLLYDTAASSQDDASEQQFVLAADDGLRDARLLLKGRLKFERQVTWSCGVMYDGATDQWLFRETGIMVAVPEIWGHIFIGRTKEGFSLNKVMVGYAGWTLERATISDATIPILADGIKWLGYSPKFRLLWNAGAYGDWLSSDQSFSTYHYQFAGRLAWMAIMPVEERRTVLHLGMSLRYGEPENRELRLRSRPESFLSPYFVETEKFAADASKMAAVEAYYRPGPFLAGTEYFFQKADAPSAGDPFFHGGDAVVSWLVTGETRTYNTRGGFFNQVSPARPVFEGGPGAWEVVTRLSYIDLDSASQRGGRFWRVTPMVNWYLSDQARIGLVYGYGSLDRFNLVGKTHFFQTRLQLQL